jgi:hypothetical protein
MSKWRNEAGEELYVPVHMLLDCTTLQDERRQWCIGGFAWVPCAERMPGEFEDVLAASTDQERPFAVAHWQPNGQTGMNDWFTTDMVPIDVVAWMPLPPKEPAPSDARGG